MNFVYVGGSKVSPTGIKHTGNDIEINKTNPFQTNLFNTQQINQIKKTDYNKSIIQQTNLALISIIGGLNQTNFDHSTLNKAISDIRGYKSAYMDTVPGSKLYLDSGGYSVIVGDVKPTDVGRFIYYYNYYLENERHIFDYMFSLDIPIFLEYPQYNTKEHIYNFNNQSLSASRDILIKYPELCDKFYFIYQFKIDGQYEIWNRLYKELELKKYIRNWAIGGMVGLRGILRRDPNSTDINFSPFTAMAYKSFFDYLNSDNVDNNFHLHSLGVYIKYDRFQLTLLEKLFQQYRVDLEHETTCTQQMFLTYDSVNYMRTAQLKVRDLIIYQFKDNDLYIHNNIQSLDDYILRDVYTEFYDDMMVDMSNLKILKNLNNIDTFTPINVYSNKQLDYFFDYIIDKYEIVNEFMKANNWETLSKKLNVIILTLSAQYPDIFNSKLTTCVRENFRITYIFHHWYQNNRTEDKLNTLINSFVNKIGFPFKLG